MASIELTESALATVKGALRVEFPDVRSSHLTEALAAALGRRTHAALLAELPSLRDDPPIELLDDDHFDQRLQEFGYLPEPEFSFELLDDSGVFTTMDPNAWNIDYKSVRDKAWRNLMVGAINAGLRQKLFSLRLDDNRWPDANKEGGLYDFTLPNGLPVRAYVHDIHHGELSIHAAVNPIGNWVRAGNAGFAAGDAVATGWLERKLGLWLQSATTQFSCRMVLLPVLAAMNIAPLGYGDRGRVI